MKLTCALALAGGYILGRTRKAKAAIGLGMWLTGRNYHPKDLLRDQAVRLLHSTEGEQLISQIRGPATEAGRRAAAAVYEAQVDRLTDALAARTERLTATLGGTEKAGREATGAVRETVGKIVGSVVPGRPATGQDEAETGRAADQADADESDKSDESDESDDTDEGAPEPAAGRQVPDRSPGPRRDARRDPLERAAAQGSTGGGSR